MNMIIEHNVSPLNKSMCYVGYVTCILMHLYSLLLVGMGSTLVLNVFQKDNKTILVLT